MNNQHTKSARLARLTVLAIAACLVIVLSVVCLVHCANTDGDLTNSEVLSKEELLARAEAITDTGKSFTASYIDEIGIKGYDRTKLKRIETYYETLYVKKLPSKTELAKETVSLYVEHFYDTIDHSDSAAVTDAVVRCFVAATGDRYSVYRTEEESKIFTEDSSGTFVGVGISILTELDEEGRIIVLSVYEDSPAEKAGMKAGDLITEVNGESVKEMGIDVASSKVRGEEGTSVSITVLRNGQTLVLTAIRAKIEEKTVDYKILENGYGYIAVTAFKGNTPEQFKTAVDYMESNGVKGIIFDMRNNPGGLLDAVTSMLSYLVPTGTTVVSYDAKDEERITLKAPADNKDGTDHFVTLPIAVLCNRYSASAAELFTSALRDYNDMGILNAITVGEKTYAKGVMQSTYRLYDGSTLTITMALYNPPSGVNYDGIGITPDYPVEEDEEIIDYAAGILDGQKD